MSDPGQPLWKTIPADELAELKSEAISANQQVLVLAESNAKLAERVGKQNGANNDAD